MPSPAGTATGSWPEFFSWPSTGWETVSTEHWPGSASSNVRATASTWTTSSTASAGWRSWLGWHCRGTCILTLRSASWWGSCCYRSSPTWPLTRWENFNSRSGASAPRSCAFCLSIGNVALLYRPMVFHGHYRLFDVGGAVGIAGMTAMLIFFTVRNTRRLHAEEPIR